MRARSAFWALVLLIASSLFTAHAGAYDLMQHRDVLLRSRGFDASFPESPVPGFSRVRMPPVTPAESERGIGARPVPENLNPHLGVGVVAKAAPSPLPPSITELARALRNDADLIYEFVRNNIEFYPIWGVQKGPLGALLDSQGTAFDQAALMVALLRQAGYTAGFVKGRIMLTAADVGTWLGISINDSCAVLTLFGAARIPVAQAFNTSGGCSPLASMQIDHLWVKVNIGGTNYVFDPSFKPHASKAGINLAAATGYNATTFMNAARAGATITPDYIQNANRTSVRTNLATYANNLTTYLRTNLPASDLADLVGGNAITPYSGPALRQTTLPNQNTSVAVTEFADIPASYKPTLRVQYAGIDATFTSDAIYGARLTVTYDGGNHAVLSLEGNVVSTSAGTLTPGSFAAINFTVTHTPYGDASADHAFTQFVSAGGTYVVGNAWGPATRGPVSFHQRRLDTAVAAGAADTSELVLGSTLAVLSSTWLAQTNRAYQILDRLGGTTSTFHHQVGIAGYSQAAYVDLPGNLVSVTSQTSDSAREDAVFFAEAMHGSIFESTSVQQVSGVTALSTVKLLDKAVEAGLRVYNATSSNYAGTVEPNLVNCASFVSSFQSAINAGNRLILPSRCDITENAWSGTGYFDIAPAGAGIGSIINGGFGGFSSQPQAPSNLKVNAVLMIEDRPDELGLRGLTIQEPIDLVTGHYLYDRVDLLTGIGSLPTALPFRRLYTSGRRTASGPLGRGWTHNFAITASVNSDGLQAMGDESALEAAATVAELFVSLDLLTDATKPLDKMVATAIAQRWFSERLLGNTVMIRQGSKGDVYVRLMDGSFSAPPGNSSKLIDNGDGTFSLEMLHKEKMNFNASGKIATYVYPNGLQINFTYSGNDLVQIQNSFGRTLTLTNASGRVTSVSDGARSVAYAYDGSGNLTAFSDATAKSTSFQYDLPGRLTKIFYPSSPGSAFVTNSYDSLDRVQTQTNANGKTWNLYFAGTRTESVAPDSSSEVWQLNALGRIVKAVDQLGRVTTNDYDAQQRLTRKTLPEGNAIEYDYDDVPCVAQLRCTHNIKTMRRVAKPASGLATLTTNVVYETAFNRPSAVTDPRGKTTNYSYNAQGDILQILFPQDAGGTRPQEDYTYTSFAPAGFPSFSLLAKVTSLIGVGDSVDRTLAYSAGNRYAPVTAVIDAGAGKLNLTTNYTYDAVGNLTQIDGPRSDVSDTTGFQYDAERRITVIVDAFGKQTRRVFDNDGRLTTVARQFGAQWLVGCRNYSASGQLVKSWGPAVTASDTTCPALAAPVAITDYVYDDLDRIIQQSQSLTAGEGGSRVSQFVWTLDGRVQTVKKAVGTGLAQNEAAYTYTPNGFRATLTDAKSNRTTYVYDGHDRQSKLMLPDKVTPNTSSATDYEQYDYDANTNLTSLRKRNGQTITFAYDNLNRLVSRTYPTAADNVNIGYDLLGRVLFANYADNSHNVTFAWDHAGRIASTTAGGRTLGYLYDAAGNRIRTTWPEATPFYVTIDYDALNRPTAIKELGASTLASYAYDDLSRRTIVSLGNSTSTTYAFDAQGMLASLAHNLGGTSSDVTFGYTHNQAGEIVGINASNPLFDWTGATAGSTAFASNGLNQYTSVAGSALTYDGSANLSATGTWTYGYDTEGRLRTANGPVAGTLSYDSLGRLRQTTIAGATTQLLYEDGRLVAEYDGPGNLLRRYVHGPSTNEPLVKYEGSGTGSKSWYYGDHVHSIVAAADAAGTAIATLSYGPFGETGTTQPGRFGYTGHQFLAGLDLYHARARTYSPQLGRFLQPDPIGFHAGPNLYAYVDNDPVNHWDPTGLWTIQIGFGGGGLWGALAGQFGFGIVIDGHGNVGFYGGVGGGGGTGLQASADFQAYTSDADTIYDLAGGGAAAGVHYGEGFGASREHFRGTGQHGQEVTGAGFTIGGNVGLGYTVTATQTQICGIIGDARCAGPLYTTPQPPAGPPK